MINTILLDLDGVLLDYDASKLEGIEDRHGLERGSLFATAFEPELLDRILTGKITRAEWFGEVGVRLRQPAAAADWYEVKGTPNAAMLAELDQLRGRGLRVAVLTNGTDETRAEVEAFGILDHVDTFFNSSDTGYAKPDRRVFTHVCAELGVDATTVFFTDDSASKLVGAQELGMLTHHFVGLRPFQAALSDALSSNAARKKSSKD